MFIYLFCLVHLQNHSSVHRKSLDNQEGNEDIGSLASILGNGK